MVACLVLFCLCAVRKGSERLVVVVVVVAVSELMEATTTTAVAASRSSCVLARFATARPLTPPHTTRRRTTTTKLSCLVSPSFFFSRPPVLCLRVSSSSRKSWNAGSSGDCGRSNNVLPRVRSSPGGGGGGGGGGGSSSSDDGDIEEWNDGGEQSRRRIGKDAAAAAARVGMLVAALISLPGVVSLPPLAIGVEEEASFSHVLQQEEDDVVFRGGLGMTSLQAPSLAGNEEASSRSCPSATVSVTQLLSVSPCCCFEPLLIAERCDLDNEITCSGVL